MRIRSLLFVPGKEKTLRKIGEFNADSYIIDLEDSIELSMKQIALEAVVSKLEEIKNKGYKIFVRLNKGSFLEEAKKLHNISSNIGFVLPKCEDIREYDAAKCIWDKHEVIALVETPRGIINIANIAKTKWVNALAFGAEDYTASVNMENNYIYLSYPKSKIVTYAKAYGKQVYDTPSFQLSDQDMFEKEVDNAVSLGFEGKMAISPKHLDYINNQFGIGDLEFIQLVVEAYEKQGQAIMMFEGKVYEKMHIERLKRVLKENER